MNAPFHLTYLLYHFSTSFLIKMENDTFKKEYDKKISVIQSGMLYRQNAAITKSLRLQFLPPDGLLQQHTCFSVFL